MEHLCLSISMNTKQLIPPQTFVQFNEQCPQFINFLLFSMGNDCSLQDKITINILVNNTHISQLKVFCGSQIPPSVMSNGRYLEIRFDVLSKDPQYRGFSFKYDFVTGKIKLVIPKYCTYTECKMNCKRSNFILALNLIW